MTKLFACFALFCLVGTAFSAVGTTCVDNSLLGIYKFTAEAKEIAGTGLKYCKSLKAGTSCCAATIVDTFQDKIDAVAKTLTDSVIKRDKAIIALRDTTIPALTKDLEALETNAKAALVKIVAAQQPPAGTREDESTVKPYTLEEANTLANNLETLAEEAIDNLGDATEGFTAFQKARTLCVNQLLNLQAAAWCLACDPTAKTQGVGDAGAITLSDDTCTRLQESCYEYVTASLTQSNLLTVGWISDIIDELNTALKAITDSTDEPTRTAALQKLSDAVEPAETKGLDDALEPSAPPKECTAEDKCAWICTGLFKAGVVDQNALVIGGQSTTPLVATTDVAPAGTRLLQASSWAPAEDEAGVVVDFEDDPAEVNSDDEEDTVTPAGAGIIKSGFVCVIALLSVFFF